MKRKQQNEASERSRKQRNCASQKAYRQRQNLYIRELEEKLAASSQSDLERISDISQNVAKYRNKLLVAYRKLESTRISLQAVLDDVAEALDMNQKRPKCLCATSRRKASADLHATDVLAEPSTQDTDNQNDYSPPRNLAQCFPLGQRAQNLPHVTESVSEQSSSPAEDVLPQDCDYIESGEDNIMALDHDSTDFAFVAQAIGEPLSHSIDEPLLGSNLVNGNSIPQTFQQDIWSAQPFRISSPQSQISATLASVAGTSDFNGLQSSVSPFSDHITVFHSLLRKNILGLQPNDKNTAILVGTIASALISNFVHTSWPAMTDFMVYTNAYPSVAKVTAWCAAPSTFTYADLDPHYQPTQLQLTMPHPSVIDWVPFPALRDLLILRYRDNPALDDIVAEIADSYCCETDLSKLVGQFTGSCSGFVRIKDIINAMTSVRTVRSGVVGSSNVHRGCSLPAPDAVTLFTSQEIAWAAYRLLGMDKGLGAMCLDPKFFEAHPELYDTKMSSVIAKGIALRPPSTLFHPSPKPLIVSPEIILSYQSIVFSAIPEPSGPHEAHTQQPISTSEQLHQPFWSNQPGFGCTGISSRG